VPEQSPGSRAGSHGAISRRSVLTGAAGIAGSLICPGVSAAGSAAYALAMHGAPRWPESFIHPSYTRLDAPKGGRLVQGVLGTFDSLNPFIVKGLPAQNLRGYVYESLLARGYDEPFTLYALIASGVETNADRTKVTFTIDSGAKFADGKKITPDDVIFSWKLLRDHGRPNYHTYYVKVVEARKLGPDVVMFDLSGSDDRELPLILGLMPVLPRHAIDLATFEDTTFTPIVGSGPYTIGEVKVGDSVTLRRDPNYWGRDVPVNRGLWNFDEVRFDYYRDANTQFEAFKTGLCDVRAETDPNLWKTAYDFPARRDGRVVQESFPYGLPKGMTAFVFNTRRAVFTDARVREALLHLFDFEWINHNFFFDQYRRTASYFDDCDLSAHGRPADARERDLLAPYANEVRDDIMQGKWVPPINDGSGRDRNQLRRALNLLKAAGYVLKGTDLVHAGSGRPLQFEFLTARRDEERIALAFARNLKHAGIRMDVRTVDATQNERRRISFDFDMIQYRWEQSLSPGNEQYFYWGSAAAGQDGSRNYMGVKSKGVDAMIGAMLAARERPDFAAATRALDRLLLSGFYVIPLFYLPQQWVARWTRIAHPKQTSLFGYLPETWWSATAT
jgi:peptide/nickel transport system substrate-binding protein